MTFPRLPDWLVYTAVVVAVLVAARGRQENADAPPPPPISAQEAALATGTLSESEAGEGEVRVPKSLSPSETGTAFSVAQSGVWLTARHVVQDCKQVAVIVAAGRGVIAEVRLDPKADIAILLTQGGSPPLPLAPQVPGNAGELAFHPGFPRGSAGEVASRYLGQQTLRGRGRAGRDQSVLSWAEVGRTEGLSGSLAGLSGAPALDAAGRVIGVTLSETPRRGKIYSTTPGSLAAALRLAGPTKAAPFPEIVLDSTIGEPITVENYGRVADGLRRDLRVVRVACLRG
jgi:S1-C subfamily serine protease